jgi:hypothetical protein
MLLFAATGDLAGAEAPRTGRRLLGVRVPSWLAKPVAVTVGLTLLTAWLFPAFSRQWQDRQKAREVTAGLVSQIGRNTSQALVMSSFITQHRFQSTEEPSQRGFNQDLFNQLDLEFQTSAAEIEAQLRAYYPSGVVAEWRAYSDLVWRTYRLITNNQSTRKQTVNQLRREFGRELNPTHITRMATPWWDKPQEKSSGPRNAYYYVWRAVLRRRSVVIDKMLESHLAGFSTRPSDALHDLVPLY